MTQPFFDQSRDRAIEDPSNLWLIHPLSRAALAPALRMRISANLVSVCGLLSGLTAAFFYWHWQNPAMAACGLFFSVIWLIADGLDGQIARATGTTSATGRILDGVCDHLVFVCIYVVLATSIGTVTAWALALTAGACHAIQSGLYEAERARYHRRIRGDWGKPPPSGARNIIVRTYDAIYHALDHIAERFDAPLRPLPPERSGHIASAYRRRAARPMKYMSFLSANTRVFAIFLSVALGDPTLFWWFEIITLSLWAIVTISWHRKVEKKLFHSLS